MKNLTNPNPNLHFFLPEDQSLFDYDYIFSASAMWLQLGMEDADATFDLMVRDLPNHRNFLLFTGLEEMIAGILNWKFTKSDIAFLLKRNIITKKLAEKLKTFRFSGDVWAMPEGTIFFGNEPVLRITGKLWEVNLLTFFLMNSLSSNTVFSSKLARCFLASEGKIYVATCPPVRGHAHEAALKFGRAAYLFGSASGMVPGFARKFDIPYESKARAFHAFIKSFPTELEAMRAAASVFPNCSVMIDTYDLNQGIANAITVALEQKAQNKPVFSAVFIDSGKDVAEFTSRAKMVRTKLDKAGLQEIQIIVAGNFQEYKIAELVRRNAPVDKVILGTEAITPADDPRLEAVFKMGQYVLNGRTHLTAKLATGKVSYPGIKQVYRTYSQGEFKHDVIGLAEEKNLGEPLLEEYIKKGQLIKKLPTLAQLQAYVAKQMAQLPPELRQIDRSVQYPVKTSQRLETLLESAKNQHARKH